MANASIEVHRRRVTEEVYKGRPIGAHEYFLEFSITVDEEGCYAIHVALFDEDNITANDQFASTNDAELQCYCLKASAPKKFYITGAAPAPTGSAMPPRSDGIQLSGLTGSWPESDGPFYDTLEVFARIRLFRCAEGPCPGDDCGTIYVRRLGDPVATWTTFRDDVDIEDGEGVDEGIDLIKEGAGAVPSLATTLAQSPAAAQPSGDALAMVRYQRFLAELPKRLKRLEVREFPAPVSETGADQG